MCAARRGCPKTTTPVIPADHPVIPASPSVIPADHPVIPADYPVIPADAGTQKNKAPRNNRPLSRWAGEG